MTYNARLAAEKTKAEKKSRKSLAKYHAEIKRNGKPARAPVLSPAPIQRIKRTLNVWEFTAADEILAAYQAAAGVPVARDVDLDLPAAPPRFGAADDRAAHQSDLARTYQAWRKDLAGTRLLAVATDVLFAERSLRAIDARYRWRKGLARGYLGLALRHFAALRGNTPRNAKGWKVNC